VFDPCLSCATHALGKMPLEVELLIAEGARVDVLFAHRMALSDMQHQTSDLRSSKNKQRN